MNISGKSIAALVLLLLVATPGKAQVFADWTARPSLSLKYKIDKDWSVAGTYYMYLDHNIGEYNKSVIGLEAGYDINSWLEASIDYRYELKNGEHAHNLRYSATLELDLSKTWKLEYRPLIEQEFKSLKRSYLADHSIKYYWRNRLTLSYEIAKDLELYTFTENYLRVKESDFLFDAQRSALGVEYDLNAQHEIESRFEVKNKKSGKNEARIVLGYTYTFGYQKPEKLPL